MTINLCGVEVTDTMDKIYKEENDDIMCCGKDLNLLCHADGYDSYTNYYRCECGNTIAVKHKIGKHKMW